MIALIRTLFSRELFALGLRDLRAHKLRSFLTALGMIFGVGAVICMLSIGEGASAEQLESIRLMGSENIILRSVEPPASQQAGDGAESMQQYGLRNVDIERIQALPHVSDIVRLREVGDRVTRIERKFECPVLGTTPNYFEIVNLRIARGRPLVAADDSERLKVCVIGAEVARSLFAHEDPLGQTLSVQNPSTGPVPYTVVGVLADALTAGNPAKGAGTRNVNRDVYIPFGTADLRYGVLRVRWSRTSRSIKKIELSDVYVHVDQQENVLATSRMIDRALQYGRKNTDYAITVPLELLRQAEENKRVWQIVLASIAGVSLLVGGIGIMNIMLASVTERTREIGIRRALGAKRYHITAQFLVETVLLSVGGGLIGILLGIGSAKLVGMAAQMQTIVVWWGVVLSFLVSVFVGISFGLYPARAAARLDPIAALNSSARTA